MKRLILLLIVCGWLCSCQTTEYDVHPKVIYASPEVAYIIDTLNLKTRIDK